MKKKSLVTCVLLMISYCTIMAVEQICLTPKGGLLPVFMPNGKKIVFVKEDKDGDKALFTKEISTPKAAPVPMGIKGESPLFINGKMVYFTGPFFAFNVMLYELQTKKSEKIPVGNPPNGMAFKCAKNMIAYPSGFGEDTKLIALDIAARKQVAVPLKLPVGTQVLSPDMKLAAVAFKNKDKVNSLKLVNIKSGKTVWEAKPGSNSSGMEIGGCHSPAFCPDGKKLAFVSAGIQPIADILLLDLKSKKVKHLTTDKADNQSPVFSPDGKKLAYSSARGNAYRIWIMVLE